MKRARYHHGDLRNALLVATIELVRERGARGFSVSEAARRAGVSITAPYRHFADREAMLAAVALRGFTQLEEVFTSRTEQDPVERLVAIADAYVAFARADPALFEVMFASGIDKESHPDVLARAYRVQELLVDAVGKLTPDDRERRAAEFWSIAHGVAALATEDRLRYLTAEAGSLAGTAVRAWSAGLT
ncbi:TetR/AcrR family transcriptional regulator [Symbioplanes lichenis]|uniref:TetR/AcrR family transcriptional regulator n=1 Tax=Symbioplanes lichenis TaxID=1629072 RepID=UPI0027387FD7|nr:TetR/AcrR family transcriptional regulator [Actinoplanes lichenis]